MINSRRLTFQLTPLLDLLMIVIFAQYMEVRISALQEVERATAERQTASEENDSLRQQVDNWESQQRIIDKKQHREREQLGQIIGELFQIPESTLNRIVQPRSKNESSVLSPADIADLKAQFQHLANTRGERVVDHLLTFNEMRKKFDVWEFYLDDDGALSITIGQDRQQVKSKVIETPEAFFDVVLQVRKQFPPAKNSILILCSYGNCRLLNRLAMTRGLPAIAERLKSDGRGTQSFEYAIFGYRPAPDLE